MRVQPVGQLVFPVGERQRVGGRRPRTKLAPERVNGDEPVGGQRPLGEADQRAKQRLAGVLQVLDGAHGGRGRVVESCARPAASVPSATRASRWRTAPPCCARSGRSPRSDARRTETRPGPGRQAQRPGSGASARDRRRGRCSDTPPCRSRPGSRRPTPGRSITLTTETSCPVRRSSSTWPSSSTHQESAGSPSVKRISPASKCISVPTAISWLICSSVSPSNRKMSRRSSARTLAPFCRPVRRRLLARSWPDTICAGEKRC